LHVVMVCCGVWGWGGRRGGAVEGSRATDWVGGAERTAGGVAAAVVVVVPCSAALVVAVSFVSAVEKAVFHIYRARAAAGVGGRWPCLVHVPRAG
jgi:hypothetical protein